MEPPRKIIMIKKNKGLRMDSWGPPAFKRLAEEEASTEHIERGQTSGKTMTITLVWSLTAFQAE